MIANIQSLLRDGIKKAHFDYKGMTGYWWLSDAASEGFMNVVIAQEFFRQHGSQKVFVELPVGKILSTLKGNNESDGRRIDLAVLDRANTPAALIEMKRVASKSQLLGSVKKDVQKLLNIGELFHNADAPLHLAIGVYLYASGSNKESSIRKINALADEAKKEEFAPAWTISESVFDTEEFVDEAASARWWSAGSLVMSKTITT